MMTGAITETGERPAPKGRRPSYSFAGCAWLVSYHVGVCSYLQEHEDLSTAHFLGTSSGSIAATMMAAGVRAALAQDIILDLAIESRRGWLGPFGMMSYLLAKGMERGLPEDAYKRVRDRLTISVTQMPFVNNRRLPDRGLRGNDELIRIVRASCYIPVYYERPVILDRRLYIDGGLTDNCPVLDELTIRVSPKPSLQSCRVDIGPEVEPRLRDAVFPDVDVLDGLFAQGYADAKCFFEDRKVAAPSGEGRGETLRLQPSAV